MTGVLLKAGRSDQTSPGEWWRVRKLIRHQGDGISGVGESDETDVAGFLLLRTRPKGRNLTKV